MVKIGSLDIADVLHDFVANALTPDSGVDAAGFWAALESIVTDLGPRNSALLARRTNCKPSSTDGTPAIATATTTTTTSPSCAASAISTTLPPTSPSRQSVSIRRSPRSRSAARGPARQRPPHPQPANARWGSLYDALRHRHDQRRRRRRGRAGLQPDPGGEGDRVGAPVPRLPSP
ncbi:MAG: hypothetical protein R2695_18830 [Acidimicrobiales bacterium]